MATLRQTIATNVLTVTRFRDLLRKIRSYRPNDDLALVKKAYEFSLQHHTGQTRASGEPYLVHPLEVATVLAEMRLDTTAIAAGLLHDAVEDTKVTIDEIKTEFGEQVAHIVEGVTKISKLEFASREEAQAESVRKMVLAMVDDIRVVLIKLADRLHNMRTLQHLPPDRQQKIARETQEIYAPIAHRLGMGKIRGELEDLAFQYVDPIAYDQVKEAIESRRKEGEAFLSEVEKIIESKMKEAGIRGRVDTRIKRIYSIWQKLQRQRISVDQIYDMLALRVITQSVNDCYAVLGIIHNQWRPVPGRIKDFIAMPRPNLYKSLHTTVIAENGHAFEVQIRTEEMHRMAEEGIAAHWKYKDGPVSARDEQRLAWLRQVVEWQRDVSNAEEFVSTLKIDLFPEEVYTFTPKGQVKAFPRGATPIDFAYAVHTDVGHRCVGARINGKMVPLRTRLKNGDIVDIVTATGHKPSRDWLNFVVTSHARYEIKYLIRREERIRAIDLGRKVLEKEARRYDLNIKTLVEDPASARALVEFGASKPDEVFALVGYGKLAPRQLLAKLVPPDRLQEKAPEGPVAAVVKRVFGAGEEKIKVRGIDDLMVFRARCCNPIKGEQIVGYITRGKGVSVHSATCPNVVNLLYDPERRIDVEWDKGGAEEAGAPYTVKLTMEVEDRKGLLAAVSAKIADINTNIRNMEAHTDDDRHARIDVTVEISDLKHLERVMKSLRAVDGVLDVERSGGAGRAG